MKLHAGVVVAWLAASGLGSGPAFADEPLRVAYRHLAESPEKYAGRHVQVPACVATAMHHGAYLYDCDDPHVRIITLAGPPMILEELFGTRDLLRARRAAATVSGVFEWRPEAPPQCCADNRVLLHADSVSGVTRLPPLSNE